MKVLIDGYNLKNPQGSGIKYYGIKILELLHKQGDEVATLFDFKIDSNIPVVQSSEFYRDILVENCDKLTKLSMVKTLLKKNIIYKLDLDKIEIQKKDEYLKYGPIYNIPKLFAKSLIKKKIYLEEMLDLNSSIDIFHATYPLNISIKNTKKITTVHDVIPLKIPYVSLENKQTFYNLVKKSINSSEKIITISESSKKDIMEFFDIDESKIVNTYQSVYIPPLKSYHKNYKNLKKFKLKKDKYILFVGNIEPKKNLGRVIEAFNRLDTNIKLVIVGKKAWMWENELKYYKDKKMKMLSYISRDDLTLLYANAKAFIFPSLYEGFGLPPLEAMACECPVITSNSSSLPEVCGDAAIYCDPYSIDSIANALEKMLSLSREDKEDLINKGLKRVEFFNDNDYYTRLKNIYESVL